MSYSIKPNYVHKEKVESKEVSPGDYWTKDRIKMSSLYQYHVYELAYHYYRKNQTVKTILDVGSGPGTKSFIFFSKETHCKVTLVDQETVKSIAKEIFPNANFVAADLDKPNDLNEKYDLIICADVIEHLLHPENLLKTIRSSMHDETTLVISTPERDILRGRDNSYSVHPEHVREWNTSEFIKFLENDGFCVNKSFLLPQTKVNKYIFGYSRLLSKIRTIPKYHANQTHVCKLK